MDDSSIESIDLLAETQPEFATEADIFGETKPPPADEMSVTPSPTVKKRDATSPESEEEQSPAKRGRHKSPIPPSSSTTKPSTANTPTPRPTTTPLGKTSEDEQLFHTPLNNQDQKPTAQPTNKPTSLLGTPSNASTDGDFLLRMCVPPFATLDDVMLILRPLFPEDITLSKVQLVSPVESPGPECINYPTYCLIYSPSGETTTHLYNQLLSMNIFNAKCSPVHLRPSDDNDYSCCKINNKLSKMSSDSLIIWMKNDCPVQLHPALAKILLTTRDEPQLMMAKYLTLKSTGTNSTSK